MTTSTATVTTTAAELVPARTRAQRGWITIYVPEDAGSAIHVGPADVTDTTGHRVPPGFGLHIENTALASPATEAWHAVAESGSVEAVINEGV